MVGTHVPHRIGHSTLTDSSEHSPASSATQVAGSGSPLQVETVLVSDVVVVFVAVVAVRVTVVADAVVTVATVIEVVVV